MYPSTRSSRVELGKHTCRHHQRLVKLKQSGQVDGSAGGDVGGELQDLRLAQAYPERGQYVTQDGLDLRGGAAAVGGGQGPQHSAGVGPALRRDPRRHRGARRGPGPGRRCGCGSGRVGVVHGDVSPSTRTLVLIGQYPGRCGVQPRRAARERIRDGWDETWGQGMGPVEGACSCGAFLC